MNKSQRRKSENWNRNQIDYKTENVLKLLFLDPPNCALNSANRWIRYEVWENDKYRTLPKTTDPCFLEELIYRKYFSCFLQTYRNLVSVLTDLLWSSGTVDCNVCESAERFPTCICQSKSTRQHSDSCRMFLVWQRCFSPLTYRLAATALEIFIPKWSFFY